MNCYSETYSTRSALWWMLFGVSVVVLGVCAVWVVGSRFSKGTPMIAAGFWAICVLATGYTLVFPKRYEISVTGDSLVFVEPTARGVVPLGEIRRLDIAAGGMMQIDTVDGRRVTAATTAVRDPKGLISAVLAGAPQVEVVYLGKRVTS